MQMKIGRWEGLYPRIQRAAKHIRCGFVCGYRKIAGPFRSEWSAIIGAAQPGVHGPDTQARTGPPRRSESNESMEHHCRKQALPNGQRLSVWQSRRKRSATAKQHQHDSDSRIHTVRQGGIGNA